VRILIFHGYLLGGTGSNVYTAELAQTLVALGHEVHLFTQDRHPERHSFVDALADWERGELEVVRRKEPVRCTAYRPDIGGLLPVYVLDRYEGTEARVFGACSDEELCRYLDANVKAVAEVADRAAPEIGLANHLVMGPVILARALRGRIPYAVKIHGSALEYTVKPEPERFLSYAVEGIEDATAVLVGSTHTARSLWEALGDPPGLRERTRLGPPGVDVHGFAPREPAAAAAGLRALSARLSARPARLPESGDAFARDDRRAGATLSRLDPSRERLAIYVGKLILSKGIDLLLVSWPLVIDQVPDASLVVVGFGALEAALEHLLERLSAGDLAAVRSWAASGRELEGARARPLAHMDAFLDRLESDAATRRRARYLEAARALPQRVVLTGRLDHAELADLLPACEALVVPSTFPEAFGMVAVEGAACGVLPISAGHSGLAEVSQQLARALPEAAGSWLSFPLGDGVVEAISERVIAWMTAPPRVRDQTRTALVGAVRERWSWESVATGVIAAASGRLQGLPSPDR
jgi:glycosyltransferase involved in cell wall biosynthesis